MVLLADIYSPRAYPAASPKGAAEILLTLHEHPALETCVSETNINGQGEQRAPTRLETLSALRHLVLNISLRETRRDEWYLLVQSKWESWVRECKPSEVVFQLLSGVAQRSLAVLASSESFEQHLAAAEKWFGNVLASSPPEWLYKVAVIERTIVQVCREVRMFRGATPEEEEGFLAGLQLNYEQKVLTPELFGNRLPMKRLEWALTLMNAAEFAPPGRLAIQLFDLAESAALDAGLVSKRASRLLQVCRAESARQCLEYAALLQQKDDTSTKAKEYLLAGLARLEHVPHVEALRARISLRLARLSQDPAPLTTVVAELEGSSGATVRLLRADVLAEIAIISNSVPRWNSAKAAYKSLAVLSSRLHYAIAEYRFMKRSGNGVLLTKSFARLRECYGLITCLAQGPQASEWVSELLEAAATLTRACIAQQQMRCYHNSDIAEFAMTLPPVLRQHSLVRDLLDDEDEEVPASSDS